MFAVCGPCQGEIGNIVVLMAGSKCVARLGGETGYTDVFGIQVPNTWLTLIGHDSIPFHYFGQDSFAGEIMWNLRWMTDNQATMQATHAAGMG